MFNIFSKQKAETIKRDIVLMTKSNDQIIQEIHDSFYSEVDSLLASAKISRSAETTKQELIQKAEKLKALGFSQTKECQDAQAEINRLSQIQEENRAKEKLIETINYFSFKYPNYKFITEDSVKKICAKYNLIYSEVSRYTGTVPDKNLKHIEDFKINPNDDCWAEESSYDFGWGSPRVSKKYFSGKVIEDKIQDELMQKEYLESLSPDEKTLHLWREMDRPIYFGGTNSHHRVTEYKSPLEIVAPVSDFNTEDMELNDFTLSKIEIPDPIVLKPVYHNDKKHYLIVTAWGLEASDELVVNQKMN